MEFRLQFNMDNAAFEDNAGEVESILNEIADQFQRGLVRSGAIRDSNGNAIGEWEIKGD